MPADGAAATLIVKSCNRKPVALSPAKPTSALAGAGNGFVPVLLIIEGVELLLIQDPSKPPSIVTLFRMARKSVMVYVPAASHSTLFETFTNVNP